MPALRDFLARFRPAGPPGAAARAGVPADRSRELEGRDRSGWADRRSRLAALLAEADRLSSLAELMGVAALPPRERATMLAGRLIREGLLQQSALSSVDAS